MPDLNFNDYLNHFWYSAFIYLNFLFYLYKIISFGINTSSQKLCLISCTDSGSKRAFRYCIIIACSTWWYVTYICFQNTLQKFSVLLLLGIVYILSKTCKTCNRVYSLNTIIFVAHAKWCYSHAYSYRLSNYVTSVIHVYTCYCNLSHMSIFQVFLLIEESVSLLRN